MPEKNTIESLNTYTSETPEHTSSAAEDKQVPPAHKISGYQLITDLTISNMEQFDLSVLSAACDIFTPNVEALTIHENLLLSVSLGASYHPTDLGTEEVTKPRHPSSRFVT